MSQRSRVERIGIVLAVLMSATTLGMEVQQRMARPPDHTAKPPAKAAPDPGEERQGLAPLPLAEGDKEIVASGGKSPQMQGWMNGRKQYDLKVNRLIITPNERQTIGEGIQGGVMMGKDGNPTFRFTAERVIMNTETRDLEAQGHVRVESADPKRRVVFETNGMNWIAREEKLVCSNPVQVVQDGVFARARRMTADVRLRKLAFDKDIYIEADAETVKKGMGLTENGAKGGR